MENYTFKFELYNESSLSEYYNRNHCLNKAEITQACQEMLLSLSAIKQENECPAYRKHYCRSYPLIDMDGFDNMQRVLITGILENILATLAGSAKRALAVSEMEIFNRLFLFFHCAELFKNEWYFLPGISLSGDFINSCIGNDLNILYDLPVFENMGGMLDEKDGMVRPQYFNPENAIAFLQRVKVKQDRLLIQDKNLQNEGKLFHRMISGAATGDAILIVKQNREVFSARSLQTTLTEMV